ncbi:MAG: diguanylate cyclase [Thermoleophilaceae bacterium]|nr:diguanylate cyclase [Thermoleophilaceae bacterium]
MQDSIAHFVALGFAVVAAIAGISGARRAGDGFSSRSATTYTRAAICTALGFGVGIAVDNEAVFLAGACLGMAFVAVGLAIQSKEREVFVKIASEQRVDFISGLPNERLFYERLLAEHSRTKRTNQRYAIAVFEIDNYDLLSEADKTNGMKLLAESLDESIRNTDTLGRVGDHQAAVLLVDTIAEGATIGCDRACERFFFQSCGHSDNAHVTRPLTVSVGIAAYDDETIDPHQVVDNAKLALKRMHDEMDSGIKVYDRNEFVRQTINDLEALKSA